MGIEQVLCIVPQVSFSFLGEEIEKKNQFKNSIHSESVMSCFLEKRRKYCYRKDKSSFYDFSTQLIHSRNTFFIHSTLLLFIFLFTTFVLVVYWFFYLTYLFEFLISVLGRGGDCISLFEYRVNLMSFRISQQKTFLFLFLFFFILPITSHK